jgi:hypothetical protein
MVRAFRRPKVVYRIVRPPTDSMRISQDCRATSELSVLLSTSTEVATFVQRKFA